MNKLNNFILCASFFKNNLTEFLHMTSNHQKLIHYTKRLINTDTKLIEFLNRNPKYLKV